MRAYLDACVVIYYIENHPDYYFRIETLINEPHTLSVITDMCRLECRIKPLREKNEPLLAMYDSFFKTNNLLSIPFGRSVFDLATELRATHRLKTPDALHLAAALHGGCDEFWTNDRRLEKAADGRIAILAFS